MRDEVSELSSVVPAEEMPVSGGGEMTPAFARPRRLRSVLALDDLEPLARSYLPAPIFAYAAGASETNLSLADNRAAFSELGFIMRALRNVSQRSAATTLFGREYASSFGIAPIGMSALIAYRGDIAMAAAAAKANIPMIMSGSSLIRLEDVCAVNPHIWFQAYLPGDPAKIEALVDRVANAGIETLVLTVDTPIRPSRENNIRAGFSAPLRPSLSLALQGVLGARWTVKTFLRTLVKHGVPHFENSFATRGAPIIARNVERDFSMRDLWTGRISRRSGGSGRAIWSSRALSASRTRCSRATRAPTA
jgi:L-lactate dehydrogenase (cytochrome)